jgi:hypothetical protein
VTSKALRMGHRILEVPIEYSPRTLAEGKKIRAWHGIEAMWVLLKYRLLPMRRLLAAPSASAGNTAAVRAVDAEIDEEALPSLHS